MFSHAHGDDEDQASGDDCVPGFDVHVRGCDGRISLHPLDGNGYGVDQGDNGCGCGQILDASGDGHGSLGIR